MTTHELERTARKLRLEAMRMVYEGGEGHPGPALSIGDIVTVLYFEVMNIRPTEPNWPDRDRLVLSKGHSCPIVYAALSERGFFEKPVEHFRLRQLHSTFQGHPVMNKTPGIDMTSGSLGNGIAIGAGMAIAGQLQHRPYFVYVIVGDGELQEGINWEGINLAAARKLDHLIVFVDRNGWQSGGTIEEILDTNNIAERFEAFGWHAQEIDGHNYDAILGAIATAKATPGKPSVIVCDCIKGKGLSFMENNNNWHKGVLTPEQYEIVLQELGGAE